MEWNYNGALIKINENGRFEVIDCKENLNLKGLNSTSLVALKTKIRHKLPKEECFFIYKQYLNKPLKISSFLYYPKGTTQDSNENYLKLDKHHPQFNKLKKEYLKYKELQNEVYKKQEELQKNLNENMFQMTIKSL